MVLGIGLGAAGVLYVQERHLPPRLSAAESTRLRQSFERADGERQRLQGELASTEDRLRATLDENKRLAAEVGARGETVQRLRQDIASLVASLPPDPRNAPVAVRAARFEVQGDTLAYNVVLSREHAGKNPFADGAAYCASKAGLNAFSEALMQEVRYDNIRVSYVMPGSVATGFSSGDETKGADWKIAPEDVADLVVNLLRHEPRSLPSRVELRPSKPRK